MNVHVLQVAFDFSGKEDAVYPVLLRNRTETILVDCGYPGFRSLLEKAARAHHILLRELTGIIITHHDIDHLGALFELKEAYPWVKIYSSALEEKYIDGKEKSLRLQQAEDLYPLLPEDQQPAALQFQKMLAEVKPVPVDYGFATDEAPYFLDGIRIVNTPGHMPGHISIYVPESKTLIAADAVVVQNGELDIAHPSFALDLHQAVASVDKLRQYDIETIICYHGGLVADNIPGRLQQLVARYH